MENPNMHLRHEDRRKYIYAPFQTLMKFSNLHIFIYTFTYMRDKICAYKILENFDLLQPEFNPARVMLYTLNFFLLCLNVSTFD